MKNELQNILRQIGGIKNFINVVEGYEEKMKDENFVVKRFYEVKTPCFLYRWVEEGLAVEIPSSSWVEAEANTKKQTRRMLAIYEEKGIPGLMEYLEKANSFLRWYLWNNVVS